MRIFPGSVGGPKYLKALRAPMPDLPLVPTGGVNADNLGEWLDAGAVCVGAGGDLRSFELIASQQWDEIQRRARLFIAAVARARP